ncbi:MAG: ABC transporter ATP-binding protein [Maribacter sp.]|nr:ABC transporter ATP-binding protein [Maribacter sp.]
MLQIDNVTFAYAKDPVLEDISLQVAKGEHVSIIGESGCGKSTLLKIIYGKLPVTTGKVFWEEFPILGPLYNLVPGEPYMKYLAQDFDLMPFTTVAENIREYLSVFDPEAMRSRTDELLEMIEMVAFAKTKVKNLSGGQQQRVALARVLAQQPEILLLDEPFSHIDNFSKNSLRRNLFAYLKNKGITVLTATHDHHDMLPFADRVIVLKDRQIIAEDHPKHLFEHPRNLYIASLFGEANRIPINIIKSYADTKRQIIVYAHELRVSGNSGLQVAVTHSYYMGSHYLIIGDYEGQPIYFNHGTALENGKKVFLNIAIEVINQRLNL